ncbi:class A beta-lactamase [Ramlibacter sp. AN1015]|uniref:class A beta-lactamase n=1 Tax=Ramlibacter sp. AN1015 TaxID=3133428 RepID=UPI0030BFCBF9
MQRRIFNLQAFSALAATTPLAAFAARAQAGSQSWSAIERESGGRLGVATLHADHRLDGHRLDERFPMCSTFKWLAAAYVLHRVDQGLETLERRIRVGKDVLLPHSPVTSQHVGGQGMTLDALCRATITVSDNAAANLILATFGGPQALTGYVRARGDAVTRLDRWEPALNESRPGDPRDTTSVRAMAHLLHAHLVADALSPASRRQLARWMQATRTNGQRLRANLPPGWDMGSKTGTGPRGTTADVGIFWPPARPPLIVAVYLTESEADEATRSGAIARVAARVTSRS